MIEAIDGVGSHLLDAGLSALAVGSLAAFLMVICRQPARRRVVARAGLLVLVAVWPLAWASPWRRVEVVRSLHVILDPSQRFAPFDDLHGADLTARPESAPSWLVRHLTLIYLAGVGAMLGRLALTLVAGRWCLRRSTEALAALESDWNALAGCDAPRPRVSRDLSRPALVGWLRPRVVVPDRLTSDEQRGDDLRLALAHELAHWRAGDHRWQGLSQLVHAFWFWLPPLGWIIHQMRLDQEYLADQEAARLLDRTTTQYAAALLRLAGQESAARRSPGALSRTEKHPGTTGLWPRALMLVQAPGPIFRRGEVWVWGLVLTALGVVLVGSSHLSLATASPGDIEATPVPPVRRLTIAQVRLDPPGHPTARTAFTLPARVGATFRLELDVAVDGLSDLSEQSIAGFRIQAAESSEKRRETSEDRERWVRVVIDRDRGASRVWVDGNAAEFECLGQTSGKSLPLRLVAAAGRGGAYRNLVLNW